MPKIFISYRRADSQYVTDIIFDYMARHFGKDNVFLDVGSIPIGVDFRVYLRDQIAAHDVVLVIIGPEWARLMAERAGQANDFVRLEIENALQLNKFVIPVRVMNADIPDFSTLPASIHDLQWRNGAVVRRQPDLENDCNRLADGIRAYFGASAAPPPPLTRARVPSILPAPFVWIDIPAGQVTLTGGGYVPKYGQTFTVPAFAIAKYPLTNGQYAPFIEAGGYGQKKWWTEAGWQTRESEKWTEPRYWRDAQWNQPDCPVVGVSWYEAVAYCAWLSEVSGERIVLPTEQQWQRAAQGDSQRAYPWGDDWDCNRCNNSVSPCDSNQTTAVTAYEGRGDSPFGVVDMSGNVYEWCLTEYKSGSANINRTEALVLRGGSWINDGSDFFRCDDRDRSSPRNRYNDWGFRLSLS